MSGYHTGIHLFDYEVVISERGQPVFERTLSLPDRSHTNFEQHFIDGLANLGLTLATHHTVTKLKKL